LPHGIVVGVGLPGTGEPVAVDVLNRLLGAEQRYAEGLKGYRQESWVAGRLAMHRALSAVGGPAVPLLTGKGGEVVAPDGWSVSVSHKRTLAVGIACRSNGTSVGVDLEQVEPARLSIADRVLTADEKQAVGELDPSCQWTAILERFSLKEAFYKAVYPHVRRVVRFDELAVVPDLDGAARLEPRLPERDFVAEGRTEWFEGYVLATVRLTCG
jgi:4'-phosphopantetheinyl transferase EntD